MNGYDTSQDAGGVFTGKDASGVPNMSGETLAALFHRAVRFMARSHHHDGHAHHAQLHVLAILGEKEPMNQRDLLERLDIRSASLSELLAKLERGGFIERTRDEQDKRSSIITMTEQGKAELESIGERRRDMADTLFASLSSAEKQQLGELLIKVILELEEKFPDHGHGGRRHGRGHCGHRHGEHGHGDHGHHCCGQSNHDHEHGCHGHTHEHHGGEAEGPFRAGHEHRIHERPEHGGRGMRGGRHGCRGHHGEDKREEGGGREE